jgi:hypothetical protein
MRRKNRQILVFVLLRDCYIYMGPFTIVRQIKVVGIFKEGKLTSHNVANETRYSIGVGGRACASVKIIRIN